MIILQINHDERGGFNENESVISLSFLFFNIPSITARFCLVEPGQKGEKGDERDEQE